MAESTYFALDISDDAVSGILFREGKRAPVIIAAHWSAFKEKTGVDEALAAVVEHCRAKGSRCLVSLDAGHFYYRMLQLPFADLKKIQSVLPYEIEDSISFSDDPYVYDALIEPAGDQGSDIIAMLAKKATIQYWLDLLSTYDLDPAVLTVSGIPTAMAICRKHRQAPDDCVLLHIGERRSHFILIRRRTIRAFRLLPGVGGPGSRLNDDRIDPERRPESADLIKKIRRLTVETANTMMALQMPIEQSREPSVGLYGPATQWPECRYLIAQELNAQLFDPSWISYFAIEGKEKLVGSWPEGALNPALALACGVPKDRERLNFRKSEFSWKGAGRWSRPLRYGVLALVLLITAAITHQFVQFSQLKQEREQLTDQVITLYRETVTGAGPGPDPVRELQIKVNELRETATIGTGHDPEITIVRLLADISERIPPELQVSFERLVYDRKIIRIRGLTDTFNAVDTIKTFLEKSPFYSEVAIGSANISQSDQLVRFELRLDLNTSL